MQRGNTNEPKHALGAFGPGADMRLWDHVGRIRREELVCAIFWKRLFIHSVMITRQNITLGMVFSQNLIFGRPPSLPQKKHFFGQHDVGQKT